MAVINSSEIIHIHYSITHRHHKMAVEKTSLVQYNGLMDNRQLLPEISVMLVRFHKKIWD